MGSWWAFCIQKEGLEFGRKMKGIFGLILYAPSWARKRRLYYLWLLSGASKPSQGFSPFLEGKSIFFRKKRKPCLSPHARGFLFCFSNIIWGPGFWNLAFFYENPGSTCLIPDVNAHSWEISHTRGAASSLETTRQVVCSLQLSVQISKFWLL